MALKQTEFPNQAKPRQATKPLSTITEIEDTRQRFDRGEEVITLDEAWKTAKTTKSTNTSAVEALSENESVMA